MRLKKYSDITAEDKDLDEALRVRNKNTRQQNLVTREQILRSVTWIRENSDVIPAPVADYFLSQGIDWAKDVLIDLKDMAPLGMRGTFQGLLLTASDDFYQFEFTLRDDLSAIDTIDEWRNVNDEYPIDPATPGVQKSFGYLCAEVRDAVLQNG